MRLIGCHIENFGKLQDLTVEFTDGCQVFREPNGWGKSTLAVFLRVMFYGFEGETKRKDLENERKRFQPWQGGVYGGSVIFETAGKRYCAARVFGRKRQEDVFELREADTNLISRDFSEHLGEELFRINSESFCRTVFIGQNDCVTCATGDILSRLGNLADNMEDLNCYERASRMLQEELNHLTPGRKTGKIARLEDEVTRLQTAVAEWAALQDAMQQLGEQIERCRKRLQENQGNRERLEQLLEQTGKEQEQAGRRMLYQQLCAECENADAAVEEIREKFPGEIPEEETVRRLLEACDRMEQAAQGMRLEGLTREEQDQLEAGAQEESAGRESLRREQRQIPEEAARRSRKNKKCKLFLLSGVLLAVLGGILCTERLLPGVLLIDLAIVLAVLGAAGSRSAFGGKRADTDSRESAVLAMQEELRRERRRQYEKLKARQERYEGFCRQYVREKQTIQDGVWEMGYAPAEDLKGQLQRIRELGRELQYRESRFREAEKKKQEFAQQHHPEILAGARGNKELPGAAELNQRRKLLETEAGQLGQELRDSQYRMEELRETYDLRMEQKELLGNVQENLREAKKNYQKVEKTLKYLEQAKRNLTARYTDPLRERFSFYYQMITGAAPDNYAVDTDICLTVNEQGMQRDTRCLSTGYQDLVGFCLRLALVDVMYREEKPFLVLDDPFVNLDDEKMPGARLLLREAAKEYQIICFTCSGSRA